MNGEVGEVSLHGNCDRVIGNALRSAIEKGVVQIEDVVSGRYAKLVCVRLSCEGSTDCVDVAIDIQLSDEENCPFVVGRVCSRRPRCRIQYIYNMIDLVRRCGWDDKFDKGTERRDVVWIWSEAHTL